MTRGGLTICALCGRWHRIHRTESPPDTALSIRRAHAQFSSPSISRPSACLTRSRPPSHLPVPWPCGSSAKPSSSAERRKDARRHPSPAPHRASNNSRGRPLWRMIDRSVPIRSSLWSGAGTVVVVSPPRCCITRCGCRAAEPQRTRARQARGTVPVRKRSAT